MYLLRGCSCIRRVGSKVRVNALKWDFIEAINIFMTRIDGELEGANLLSLGVRRQWKKPIMNIYKYNTQFEAYVTILESYWVCVPINPDLLTEKPKAINVDDVEKPGDTDNTKAEAEVK